MKMLNMYITWKALWAIGCEFTTFWGDSWNQDKYMTLTPGSISVLSLAVVRAESLDSFNIKRKLTYKVFGQLIKSPLDFNAYIVE